jgi:hypothetical protein
MKYIHFFVILFIFSTLLSCGRSSKEASFSADYAADEVSESREIGNNEIIPQNANNQDVANKKIVKNGDISIQVENVQKARNAVETLLKSNNAYVQDESYENSDYDERINLIIRIPNQNFDTLVNSLTNNGIGKITTKNIRVEDVTEEYTDISIRLKNKQLYLEKYREFLKSAKSTRDMLEVQEKVRNMEEEIESAEGKLRFIDDRVNYSALTLYLYKEKPPRELKSNTGFFPRLWNSLVNGWDLLEGIVIGVITVWPLWILAFVIVWLVRKYLKKRRISKKNN